MSPIVFVYAVYGGEEFVKYDLELGTDGSSLEIAHEADRRRMVATEPRNCPRRAFGAHLEPSSHPAAWDSEHSLGIPRRALAANVGMPHWIHRRSRLVPTHESDSACGCTSNRHDQEQRAIVQPEIHQAIARMSVAS